MPPTIYQADLPLIKETLHNWLKKSTSAKALEWIDQKRSLIESEALVRNFFLAFGTVPRFVGRDALKLEKKDLQQADQLRKGWSPASWTTDQAARILLLLSFPHQDQQQYIHMLNQLFSTAEVGEQTALYLSFPLLPYPEAHKARTSEGIRTNMSVVFNAIALDNPYPAEYMEEAAWNQLVLKAIFIGSPLHRIQGLDQRANPALARMLSDFAHERWAAKRTLTPELWRLVGPFLDKQSIADMENLLASPDPVQQEAAALALSQSNLPEASALLHQHPDLKKRIDTKELTWAYIAQKIQS